MGLSWSHVVIALILVFVVYLKFGYRGVASATKPKVAATPAAPQQSTATRTVSPVKATTSTQAPLQQPIGTISKRPCAAVFRLARSKGSASNPHITTL